MSPVPLYMDHLPYRCLGREQLELILVHRRRLLGRLWETAVQERTGILDRAAGNPRLFLAGLGNSSAAERQAASERYDAAQKAIAAGKAPTRSGISSLMGGARIPGAGGFGGPPPGEGGQATSRKAGQAGAAASGTVVVAKKALWYMDEAGKLAVTMVEPGLSDGITTELVGADSLEGKKVILKIKAE